MDNDSLEKDREWLNGDAVTLIITGRYGIRYQLCPVFRTLETNLLTFRSDNVGATLTFVFYHLSQIPAYQDMIRQELVKSIVDDRYPASPKTAWSTKCHQRNPPALSSHTD